PPPAEDPALLRTAVKRFDDAWRQGPRPAIDDHLPAGGEMRQPLLIELVHIDLELRLKAGEAARVEEYRARFPDLEADRAAALERMAAEYALRRRREREVGLDDYLRRFPAYGAELPEQIESATLLGGGPPCRPADTGPADTPQVAGYEILGPLGRGGMG